MLTFLVGIFCRATTPQVTGTNPTSGPTGSQVQINGSGFGATQGAVKFNGSYSATIVSWSDTQIVAVVPVQAFTGALLVTAGGVSSNQTVYFNVPAPQVNTVSPSSGTVGTSVTITGSGFQATKGGNSSITFNGITATTTGWTDTQIVATVPASATTGALKVAVNGVNSNQDKTFALPNPVIASLVPSSGPVGTAVQINGSGFGASQGSSTLQFNGVSVTPTTWSDTAITATLPGTITSGNALVTVGGVATSSNVKFTVPPPQISSISPTNGPALTQVTVNGSGFQSVKGSSVLTFNGSTATTTTWSDTQIVGTVPSGTGMGPVRVVVNSVPSNLNILFTPPNPVVTAIAPSSGPVGTQVTVFGTGFGISQGSSTLKLQGIAASIISWSDSQIVATIPTSAATGYIQVTVSGVASHAGDVNFSVSTAHVNSVSPASGLINTQVTITGTGFRPVQSENGTSSSVYINGTSAPVVSWSDTQIVATVPSGATSGPVTITGMAGNSNADVLFSMPNPIVSGISPSSAGALAAVQINGSGFGSTQGSSTVTFNFNHAAAVTSWSDTQILAVVPSVAATGPVKVTVGGVTSNGNINFTIPAPYVAAVSPTSGVVGTQVTVTGSGFQASQGSNTIYIGNSQMTVNSWSDTQIVATIPAGATTSFVRVTVSVESNRDVLFTLPNPVITGFSPAGGAVGSSVQINGSGFGATQGTNTAAIGTTNVSVATWSDTLITGTVATGTTGGAVKVTVGGVTGSLGSFNVASLFVNSFSPQAGPANTSVTITGNGFGSPQGSSTISFNNVVASVSTWNNTQIVATVPASATSGPIKVTVGSSSNSTSASFVVGTVVVNSVSPGSGLSGTQVQINGSGFGTTQGSGTVTFNGFSASVTAWSGTQITATVPTQATTGAVKVTAGGVASNTTINFSVPSPYIASISPTKGPGGTAVTINGSGFGGSQGNGSVSFTGGNLTVNTWSDTVITGTVPSLAQTGTIRVINGAVGSNSNVYFAVPVAQITSVSPISGSVGTQVTINGTAFRGTQGSGSITINGTAASIVSWSDTQIVATVQPGTKTGPVTATVNGLTSNQDVTFSLPNPVLASLTPTNGPTGTQVQISGSGFGASQGTSTLTFHGANATVTGWSDTLITATVPTTASSGVVAVSVGGVTSSSPVNFTVPAPQIVSISPNRGTFGTQVTVTGSGFQATKGSNGLSFNGNFAGATIVSWSDTQIVATVPGNAVTGGVWATVNGASSNFDVGFTFFNPQITGLVPSSGPVGTQVQVNGSGFGASQGSSTVTFSGVTATVASWSDTQIVATVPASATSGIAKVTVGSIGSNTTVNFTVPTPRITSVSPGTGTVGSNVTITGSGFQSVPGNSYVYFNGTTSSTPISWSDTQIVVAVPTGATSGAVRVITNNGDTSNQDLTFNLPNPTVASLAPANGPTGTQVTINGSGFGSTQGSGTVSVNNIAATVNSWSDTQVVAVVPVTAVSGPVKVTQGGVTSNAGIYFNIPLPNITSLSPTIGGVGNSVTITGTGFQAVKGGNSWPTFNTGGSSATIKSWSDTQIVAVVPPNTSTGGVSVTVNSLAGNYLNYTLPAHSISSITPTSGSVGTQVTVAGNGFGSTQGTNTLTFNGQTATPTSWTNTQIVATVPVTAASGPAVVAIGGANSNADKIFTVPPPVVGNFQPNGGNPGTAVTIHGSGFQANQRDSTITFNGLSAAVTSWSDTQIVATVPTSAMTGPLLVHVNSVASQNTSGTQFEVPYPVITSVTPSAAPVSGTITISGAGFGPNQWYSPDGVSVIYVGFVNFNGVQVGAQSWSDTSITTTVPSNATSGNITIIKYDATSNAVPFLIGQLPTVTGLSPTVGPVASSVTITGSGFGPTQSTSTIQFSGVVANVSSWSDTQITAVVPPGSETGPVAVTVAGITGASQDFTINNSVTVTDSLGHNTNYVSTMAGGAWHPTFSMGGGCSSCNIRGSLNRDIDGSGNTLANTDELQRKTFFSYDADNNLISATRHLDPNTPVVTSYTYNSFGEPLTVTDPLGNVTTNTYDANGNLLTVTSPKPDAPTAASVTHFGYDPKGQLTTITDPLSHITTLAYYPTGLIHTITDAQQNVTTYEYDLRGNRTAVVDAQQNRTTFAYDLGNRLTGITYPDTTSVSFGYDPRGRRTSVTDQNQKTTTYAYDDADRLTSVTDAANHVTSYGYDTESNLTSITDANLHTTSFAYDEFGRATQTTFPSTLTESYVYDAVSNLTSKTDRKNQTINYVYDALNRLTQKGYPDMTAVDYVYDLAGKIKQVSDPTGTYGFAYDNLGRLIGTTTQYSFLPGNTYTNTYGYDAASNRTSFTAPDGSTNTYSYDTLSRLSTLTNSLTGQFGFSYDNLSRRTNLTRPNGVTTTYSYDTLSELLSVLHQNGTTTLDGAAYTYDGVGNRTGKTNYLNNITEHYTYDPIYQLTQVAQGATTTESYSYDPAGNRLSSLAMSSYNYNSSNELVSTSAATFTYDNNGSMLTKTDASGTTTYNWDFENRLKSVLLPGSNGSVAIKYDPFGRRVQKAFTQNSTTTVTNYVLDGASAVEETDANGNITARYAQGSDLDEALAEQRAGLTSLYLQDGLLSVTSLTSSTGVVSDSYVYDSFGNLESSIGSSGNVFQFTGRDYDTETGLRYYRARFYSSDTGRFLNEDPIGFSSGSLNLYAYVGSNPVTFTDPTGLRRDCPVPSLCEPRPLPEPPSPPALKPPPIYSPGLWDGDYVNTNNCYSYSCDRRHPPGPNHWPQPGENSGAPTPDLYCAVIKIAAKLDGLLDSPLGSCPCNYHVVKLYIAEDAHTPSPEYRHIGPDYHWYRLDSNGLWSSKHGLKPVGAQVSNPDEDAASWGYFTRCGAMCAPNGGGDGKWH